MAERQELERPLLSVWQAESLRLTAFLSPAAQVPPTPAWWKDLVGELPETQHTLPKQKVWTETGSFERGQLVLAVQSSQRVDWYYLVANDLEGGQEEPPNLGPFPEALSSFSGLMVRWLQSGSCPLVQRLAFGSTLVQSVETQHRGHQLIAAYLHSALSLEGASDFFYQINRPRLSTSGVSNLRINRLSKWSIPKWIMTQTPAIPEADFRVRQQGTLCRLELDINTAPDFPGDLPNERLSQLFEELVSLGQEIAREGDIP